MDGNQFGYHPIKSFHGGGMTKGRDYTTESLVYHLLQLKFGSDDIIRQYKISKYRVDFLVKSRNTIVEIDGIHHYKSCITALNDVKKTLFFRDLGYKVVRIPLFIPMNNFFVNFYFNLDVSPFDPDWIGFKYTQDVNLVDVILFQFLHMVRQINDDAIQRMLIENVNTAKPTVCYCSEILTIDSINDILESVGNKMIRKGYLTRQELDHYYFTDVLH